MRQPEGVCVCEDVIQLREAFSIAVEEFVSTQIQVQQCPFRIMLYSKNRERKNCKSSGLAKRKDN